jgi:hypothetical protein
MTLSTLALLISQFPIQLENKEQNNYIENEHDPLDTRIGTDYVYSFGNAAYYTKTADIQNMDILLFGFRN